MRNAAGNKNVLECLDPPNSIMHSWFGPGLLISAVFALCSCVYALEEWMWSPSAGWSLSCLCLVLCGCRLGSRHQHACAADVSGRPHSRWRSWVGRMSLVVRSANHTQQNVHKVESRIWKTTKPKVNQEIAGFMHHAARPRWSCPLK